MKVFCGLMIAVNVLSSSYVSYFILFPILPHTVCGLQFTSPFNGNKVTGILGSSVNFTWAFYGGNINRVTWGTKKDRFGDIKDVLISIDKLQTINTIQNPPYSGRVSGIWDGSSPGQATFTLNSIQKADERFYVCNLTPDSLDEPDVYDTVQLLVVEMPVISSSLTKGSYIEGSSVNISCAASGKPDPEVSWIRNGQVKCSGRKIAYLNFDQIKRTDDGLYTCTANNSAGTESHKEIVVVRYPAKILSNASSAAKSWIGQTVTLKCVSDGVPTPTLTWYSPDGNELHAITAKESTVEVSLNDEQDFGDYKCVTYNGLDPSNDFSMTVEQIQKPGLPAIIFSGTDIQATSLTVKWTTPADDGGLPITAYRVVILKGGTEIKSINTTDPGITSLSVGDLKRDTEYNVKVFARNAVFKGAAAEKTITTKTNGIPETPDIIGLSAEIHSDEVALKWTKPNSNGADITQYTLYMRNVTSNDTVGDWRKLEVIYDVSILEYVVTLEKGQQYEFLVTATNKYGESLKTQQNIKRINILEESSRSTANQNKTVVRCNNELEILHAVYLSVIILLVIIIVGISVIHLRIRRGPVTSKRREMRIRKSSLSADCIEMSTFDHHGEEFQSTETTDHDATSTTYETPNSGGDYMPLHPSTRSWEISREQVDIIKNIGKGAFSQVAKATVKSISDQDVITVAVKMLKENAPESDRKDLLSELELMKKLKPHPHVIKLIACLTESDPLLVLIEYVPYGDLLGYLRKSRGLNDTYFNNPDRKPETNLTSKQLMRFAWQIADGMAYLSSRKIIHRDLAARNVLVGEGEKCKVTDFGMARNVQQDDIYTKQSRGRLPVKWTAYEALLYGTYTTHSDVWSYGVLLYEILTIGATPYPGVNARQIASKLQEGFRMPKPKHVDNKLYQVMLTCWEEEPRDRPTFVKLKETMKEMERNHKTYVNLKEYDNTFYGNVEDLKAE